MSLGGQPPASLPELDNALLTRTIQHERELATCTGREKAELALRFRAEILPFVWQHTQALPQPGRVAAAFRCWQFEYQECVIYLRSRNRIGTDAMACRLLSVVWDACQTDTVRSWVGRGDRSPRNLEQAWDIEQHWMMDYQNFWGTNDVLDGTMLRTVDWCEIGGYEKWWNRLKSQTEEMFFCNGGGLNTVPASLWLFAMCRSRTAVQLMRFLLSGYLVGLRYRFRQEEELVLSAVALFAAEQLGIQDDVVPRAVRETAAADLLRRATDWWLPGNPPTEANRPEVVTTAICLTALAVTKPNGWRPAATAARDWLWQQQRTDGLWQPGQWQGVLLGHTLTSTWTTVLVLDALDLVAAQPGVTFEFTRASRDRARRYRLVISHEEDRWSARYDGKSFEIDPDGALMLSTLLEADGAPLTGAQLAERGLMGKPSRVKQKLPNVLCKLIEAKTAKGYWIPLPKVLA